MNALADFIRKLARAAVAVSQENLCMSTPALCELDESVRQLGDQLFPESTDPQNPNYNAACRSRQIWLDDHAPMTPIAGWIDQDAERFRWFIEHHCQWVPNHPSPWASGVLESRRGRFSADSPRIAIDKARGVLR